MPRRAQDLVLFESGFEQSRPRTLEGRAPLSFATGSLNAATARCRAPRPAKRGSMAGKHECVEGPVWEGICVQPRPLKRASSNYPCLSHRWSKWLPCTPAGASVPRCI